MSIQSDHPNISAALDLELHLAAKDLGERLHATPEFQNYIQETWAVTGDPQIQELSAEMQSHRTALRYLKGNQTFHTAELERLEQELQVSAVYQKYRQAELEVRGLFQSVDRFISQTAGVEFSANAQRRRGCCG